MAANRLEKPNLATFRCFCKNSATRSKALLRWITCVFQEIEPWGSPVDGAELLDEIRTEILRFCVLPDHSVELMAAWVLHAWVHDASDISPVLAFVSPEKRCGKSTCLSVVSVMVPKAMHTINISSSVLFRVVEAYKPTVLIDEADTFLAENEEMRGILNGGHNRLTAHVYALERVVSERARRIDDFTDDNDPWGEHDFGAIDLDSEKVFFKIDYFDLSLRQGSENPANQGCTHRVLTIMLASEY